MKIVSASTVATVDSDIMYAPDQSRCLNCGMHIVLNTAGEWQHTMQGIVPCEPAWKPRGAGRETLRLVGPS